MDPSLFSVWLKELHQFSFAAQLAPRRERGCVRASSRADIPCDAKSACEKFVTMVSSAYRGSYTTVAATTASKAAAVAPRKLLLDPQKDYSTPLQVETSVEYDLPAHIYPPKGAEPLLMVHPAYTVAVRSKARTLVGPSLSLVNKPININQLSVTLSNEVVIPQNRPTCSCGNPNCKVGNVKQFDYNVIRYQQAKIQEEATRGSVSKLKAWTSANKCMAACCNPRLEEIPRNDIMQWRNSVNKCMAGCCNPRPAAMAPSQAEFTAPGLPPSLMARTPTRGPAGGSPKLRASRTRRGLNVANSVNLPEYLGTCRSGRVGLNAAAVSAAHVHSRSRTTPAGALVAATAPHIAHQVARGASLSTTDFSLTHLLTPKSMPTSDFAVTQLLTPKTLFISASSHMQHIPSSNMSTTTSSLLSTVGQSRDSGCSVNSSLDIMATSVSNSEMRSKSLVDSGFCTPVDMSDDDFFDVPKMSSSTPIIGNAGLSFSRESFFPWKDTLSSNASIGSGLPVGGAHASYLAAPHHYLPQPIWNLAY